MAAYRLEAAPTLPASETVHKAVDQRNAAIDFLRNRKSQYYEVLARVVDSLVYSLDLSPLTVVYTCSVRCGHWW